jgi:protein arginine kinase
LIRLGIDQGFFPEDSRPVVDRLFIECQPGHIQYAAMKEKTAEERDALRAEYLRNALRELPAPTYDINENI